MASRTQLRLAQLTGSFGLTAINDQIAAAATGSIATSDLEGVLSHLAGAIKRIHGEDSFSQNAAGEFAVSIQPASDDGAALGGASNNWSDLYLADGAVINLGDDQDVQLTHVADTGILLNSTSQLQFNDAGVFIQSDADGKLKLSADGTAADSINIDSAGGVDVDAADDIALTTTSADGEIQLVTAHTAGRAVFIDANADAGSIVDIDAGILQIDATGVAGINSGGTLSLGTANSGVAVNIGHGTSEVTIGDNLTVTGDLTVNGTTTTVDTTNLLVKDKLITINDGGAASSAGGSGIEFEEDGSATGFIKTAADRAGFEFQAPGNANTLTIDAAASKTITVTGDLAIEADSAINQDLTTDADAVFNKVTANGGLVADNITIDGTQIDLSSGDLTIDVAGSLILDPGKEVLLLDDGTRYGMLSGSLSGEGAGLIVSASAGSIFLDGSTNGGVFFQRAGTKYMMAGEDSSQATLGPVSSKDLLFVDDNLDAANEIFRIDSSAKTLALPAQNAAGNSANTGLLSFNGTTDVNEAIYGDGGALYLRSNAVNFKLPTADGNSGQVLRTNGSGVLTFVDVAGSVSKTQIAISSTLASGSALNPNSATVSNVAPYTRAALDLSGIASSDLSGLLDIFVNGQLLISGSDTHVGAGDADYFVNLHTAASQIKFGFPLEAEDTVIISKKG